MSDVPRRSPRRGRASPAKNWCFTLNNWTPDQYDRIISVFRQETAKYIVGKEVGESGTPHLQGFVAFKRKLRPLQLVRIQEIHWEAARASIQENFTYCSKEGNFETNIRNCQPVDPLDGLQKHPWQLSVDGILEQAVDSRRIHWIYDFDGNTGKTAYAKHLCLRHGALFLSGKASDVKFGVSKWLEENPLDVAIFHYTRTIEKFVSYQAIEEIKDGVFFNAKYESGMVIFNHPHVVVLANFPPDTAKLSQDRWAIYKIVNFELIETPY